MTMTESAPRSNDPTERRARIEALKSQRPGEARSSRRKPAAASKWLVGAASVATGFGLVAGFAAANPASREGVSPQPAAQAPVAQPAPQVVVVRMPADRVGQAQAEPTVIQVPRAVPATDQVPQRATPAPSDQPAPVVSESGGS